jgi:hypothetical protein
MLVNLMTTQEKVHTILNMSMMIKADLFTIVILNRTIIKRYPTLFTEN